MTEHYTNIVDVHVIFIDYIEWELCDSVKHKISEEFN